MTRFLSVLLFSLGIACAAHAAPKATPKAAPQFAIAAIVNNDIITSRDVDGRMNLALQGAQMKPDAEIAKELRRQALDALIDEQIRLQEAARLNVMPTQEEIDDAFAKIAAQNRMTPEQFKKIVQEIPGVYDSMLRQLKTQAAWSNVIKKKVRPQINISENDINNYLADREKNTAKVEYQVAEIFLKKSEANKEMAQNLITQLRSGKQRFSVLARQFSQGLEASKGGMLGWIPEGRLEAPIDQAMKSTPIGQISDPVESERGLHILLLRDKREILHALESSQRIQIKQIVLPLPPQGVPKEYEEQALQHAKKMQKDAKDCDAMEALIKKINSPLSRDLGMVRLAELPQPVIATVKNLPIGKASAPVRATDGFAIMMVCGREDSTEEAMRDDVANMIGTERLNRLQHRYYRDLRSAAYVDIK